MKRSRDEANVARRGAAVGGQLIGEDRRYGAVSTDSRTLSRARCSSRCAGRISTARNSSRPPRRAAPSAPWSIARCRGALPQIVVPDALRALAAAGAGVARAISLCPSWRWRGSNGKTTAKEMTAAILSRMGPCMATHGNLNNHIGVPLTLMRLEPSHRSAVIEMGANRIGDVAELVRLARPTVGLITNAGAEHLEGFGNLDGVAKGEGEMVAGLGADGHRDHQRRRCLRRLLARSGQGGARIVTFGVHAPADFMAKNATAGDRAGRVRHALHAQVPARASSAIMLKAGGAHNIAQCLGRRRRGERRRARRSSDIAAGLADFRAVVGPPAAQGRVCATAGSSMIRTTPIRVRCAPGSRCCARCRAPPGWCSPTWRNSANMTRTATPTWAAMRATAASSACSPAGRRVRARSRPSVRAASGSPDVGFLDPPPAGGAGAGGDGADQGFARQSSGARGAGAQRRERAMRALMLLYLTEYLARSLFRLPCVSIPHAARHSCRDDCARHGDVHRAAHDRRA